MKQLLNELKDKRIEITNTLSKVKKQDWMKKIHRISLINILIRC